MEKEIFVDNGSYPNEEITYNSHMYRPLGLGFANLGSLVMSLALAYDSDQSRMLAGAIAAQSTVTGSLRLLPLGAWPLGGHIAAQSTLYGRLISVYYGRILGSVGDNRVGGSVGSNRVGGTINDGDSVTVV